MTLPSDDTSLLAQIRRGDRRAIAHAISVVEHGAPAAASVAAQVEPHRGHAHVVGITGAPGAGKSTLVNVLLGVLVAHGKRVAVIAVDPSSPLTGGAVLGDRVRMMQHGAHENVFIRSVASRGHLGGLSRTTGGIVDVLDAAGFDTIVVETVGAGQSEVEITSLADTRIVVCPPAAGDAVQAIKAGILEIADILVVNKADLDGADVTARNLADMLHLRARAAPPVAIVKTIGTDAASIAPLIDAIAAHEAQGGRGRRLRPEGARTGSGHGDAIERDATERVRRLAMRPDFAKSTGVELVEGGPGRAVVRMIVDARHLNFNGTCHGGALFTLADAAFGFASNSHGRLASGIDAHMTFHAAARAGDVLTATATEVSRSHRVAAYRIEVARAATTIATFTGTVYVSSRGNDDEA